MIRFWPILLLAAPLLAQVDPEIAEQQDLQQALSEANSSPVEFIHAIEHHLKLFPDSPRKAELERAILKYAVDLKDDRRVIQYGEIALRQQPDEIQLLNAVSVSLLRRAGREDAEKALGFATHLDELIQATYKDDNFTPAGGPKEAQRKEEFDRNHATALILEARAQGILGHHQQAVDLAQQSYRVFPSVEGAREASRWLAAAGRDKEAIQYLADAFTIAGLKSADADGASDRARLSELYEKVNGGSETGLGDLVLKAYDETSKQLAAHRAEINAFNPNAQVKDPLRYTLDGVDGERLPLGVLAGKVIVLDFWATWCVPCRVQHPLYEEVKTRYRDNTDVVFLSIDADEDHALVKPFMASAQWLQKAYFEDGLQAALQVSSIPTTVIFNKKGDIVSRMVGFLPERFVDMLSERIDDALGIPHESRAAAAPGDAGKQPPPVKGRAAGAIKQ